MTANKMPLRAAGNSSSSSSKLATTTPATATAPFARFVDNASGTRINTETVLITAIRAEYPNLHLTVVPEFACDLLAFAAAGNAAAAPIDPEPSRITERRYLAPGSRLHGGQGTLADKVVFGKFLFDWRNTEFVLYLVQGRDDSQYNPLQRNQYVLSGDVAATNALLLAAGSWSVALHDEVWVFDGGFWQKSAELWQSVQKSRWEDVILEEKMKRAIIADVDNFFASRATYERLRVPWKRGIIYYGPPGNGKTISIKAMMHSLSQRKEAEGGPVPTLYVRTLASFGGPEYSLRQIFSLARREAPCLLVFEDLDSIVDDRVRSYFLNEVDGIRKNDGILMIGSTNHLDRLDPGIAKRPSRFDRKYLFPNPSESERVAYMRYWQGKLKDNDELDFPDAICAATAKITGGFSFAYLQEAVVAALLAIARREDGKGGGGVEEEYEHLEDVVNAAESRGDDDDDDGPPELEKNLLWRELRKQIRILKDMMGDEDGEKRVIGKKLEQMTVTI